MRTSWNRRALIALACAATLAVPAGCGGGGGQSASEVAQTYVDARNQGDYAKVCDLLSSRLKARLGTSDCPAFLKEQSSGAATQLTLVGVDQSGDRATATVQSRAGGETRKAIVRLRVELARQDGDWRISGLGGGGG